MAHTTFGSITRQGLFGQIWNSAFGPSTGGEACYLKIEWVPDPPETSGRRTEGVSVGWFSDPKRPLNGSPANPNGNAPPAGQIGVKLRGKIKTTCVCKRTDSPNTGSNVGPIKRGGLSELGSSNSDGGVEYFGVVAYKYTPANGHCPQGPDGKCKGGPKYKDIRKTYYFGPSDFKGAGGRGHAGAAGCTLDSWKKLQNEVGVPEDGIGGSIIQSSSSGLGTGGGGWALARAAMAKALGKALEEGTTQIDCNLGIEEPEAV